MENEANENILPSRISISATLTLRKPKKPVPALPESAFQQSEPDSSSRPESPVPKASKDILEDYFPSPPSPLISKPYSPASSDASPHAKPSRPDNFFIQGSSESPSPSDSSSLSKSPSAASSSKTNPRGSSQRKGGRKIFNTISLGKTKLSQEWKRDSEIAKTSMDLETKKKSIKWKKKESKKEEADEADGQQEKGSHRKKVLDLRAQQKPESPRVLSTDPNVIILHPLDEEENRADEEENSEYSYQFLINLWNTKLQSKNRATTGGGQGQDYCSSDKDNSNNNSSPSSLEKVTVWDSRISALPKSTSEMVKDIRDQRNLNSGQSNNQSDHLVEIDQSFVTLEQVAPPSSHFSSLL